MSESNCFPYEEQEPLFEGIENSNIDVVGEMCTCKGCGHTLPVAEFVLRTKDYCFLCDPNITLQELLCDEL